MDNWSTYLTPGPIERQLGLFCLGFGEQHIPPAATPERALGCHAAVFLHQGRGQLLHGPDRVLRAIEGPALFWLFPGVLHGYRPATSWHQSWVLFGGTATAALTHLGYLTPEAPVRRYADARPIQRAFAKLLRVAQTSEVQAAAALYDLIATTAQADSGNELVARLRAIACRPLSIPQYAEALGVTVDELRSRHPASECIDAAGGDLDHQDERGEGVAGRVGAAGRSGRARGRVRGPGVLQQAVQCTRGAGATHVPADWFDRGRKILLLIEAGPAHGLKVLGEDPSPD